MITNFTRTVSIFCTLTAMLFFIETASAATSRWPIPKKKKKAEISNYVIRLQNSDKRYAAVDSALVILDKYDLTGAGIIIKVIPTDHNQQLNLTDIPVGKYYADIYTYGLCPQFLSTTITVSGNDKKKKSNFKKLKVIDAERYIRGQAIIPGENIKLFKLLSFRPANPGGF